jgi:diacylglycerol kinase family enzyme
VLQALRRQRLMQLDVAWSSAGPCLLVAGVGFDGAVVHELARLRQGTITRLDYVRPLLRAAWHYRYPPLSVSVDGRNICRDRRAMVFVGNVPEYGTGFALLPAARPDDGLLDVCVVPCNSLVHLASLLLRAMVGRLATAPGAVYVKGRTVSIESSVAVPAQIDGEAAGCTPLQIELLPQRLPMLCPPADEAA